MLSAVAKIPKKLFTICLQQKIFNRRINCTRNLTCSYKKVFSKLSRILQKVPERKMATQSPETQTINGKEYYTVTEGKAEILFPSSNEVFYNPVQEFNRDLTIAVIGLYAEEFLKTQDIQVKYPGDKDEETQNKESINRKSTEKLHDTSNVKAANQKDDTSTVKPTNQKDDTSTVKPTNQKDDISTVKPTNQKNDTSTVKPTNQKDDISTVKPTNQKNDTSTVKPTNQKDDDKHIKTLQPGELCEAGISILEGLSASGLRSIRFAKEIAGVKQIVANDFAAEAVESIKNNVRHNKVDGMVTASHADAALLMYQHRNPYDRYDVIDLDPYGSPSQFLDSAVQAVKDDGILCITCTDMAVLCGNHGETAYSKYGGMALHTKYGHEMALRIVLHSIESHANRYHRYIEPLLCISVDFYIRLFIRVHTGQAEVKKSASKRAMVYNCVHCETYHLQRMGKCIQTEKSLKYCPASGPPVGSSCEHCGGRFQIGGPMWAEPLHNMEFVTKLLRRVERNPGRFLTSDRIIGLLNVVSEELPDCPLYYIVGKMCNVLHCSCPSLIQLRSAILHAGYEVSLSHASPEAIKTSAPSDVIWDIMRAWVKLHPVKQERLKEGNPATKILSKEPSIEVSFTTLPSANPRSRKFKLVRFPENPQKYWGPKARAKRKGGSEPIIEKRARLQGKRGPVEGYIERDLKSYPCKRFKKGKCDLGDRCKYSHADSMCHSRDNEV
ncbi:tRNA (guanine(26)-N(2))-dimethyltransferase-like [Saccoglossus kowalevskii]|uniref:tRNA (guanine(26)-N(2))-dimethyltransferase n=1 Tax=Saccoglossus kowalevskii TaxID=10224 RepID=A0ABM0GSE0_SACKO|nr:PREDICTED: tRNA (guanine(26)-N(2))-dimethyltransferase-like [Saccoglossus kowalevskii]